MPLSQKKNDQKNKLILTPTSKLWTGIIFLDDGTRESYLSEDNITINLSRDQIITNGHGGLMLTTKNGQKVYNRQLPIRFIIKDGNISEITGEKFKELNKGKLW